MSHWQALAVKIASSSLRSPQHCSCTFTWGGGVPHSRHLPQGPLSLGSLTPANCPRLGPLTFLRPLMVQHRETEVMLCR